MTTTIGGSYPAVNSDSDATINGVTVGKGGGALASNTAIGNGALAATNTVGFNVAVGANAFNANTTGQGGVAVGSGALQNNTTGNNNTAVGINSLLFNTTGQYSSAYGTASLQSNTTGANNTAHGYGALQNNTTASNNTAVGYQALYTNTTNSNSTAVGYQAGYASTVSPNTFIGYRAGNAQTTGQFNTFVGHEAGQANTTGVQNNFFGHQAGYFVTTGTKNTIVGGYNGNQDGLDIRTASNYAVISDGDGNRLLTMANGQTLALDGGAVPNSGTGITFPATQSASSNANTLDDYEEGTFTPTIIGTTSAGTASYVAQIGTYTKVGRLVFFEIYVNWSSGTGTGFLKIDNLPFTSGNTSGYPAVSIGWFNQVALSANSVATAFVGNNESQIYFYEYATGGGASGQVAYDAAGGIQIAGCYQVG